MLQMAMGQETALDKPELQNNTIFQWKIIPRMLLIVSKLCNVG